LVINFAQTRLGTLRYIFAITGSGTAQAPMAERPVALPPENQGSRCHVTAIPTTTAIPTITAAVH